MSATGDLFAWGTGYDLLWHGADNIVWTPRQVDGIGGFVAVAFGFWHAIVVTRDCIVFSVGFRILNPFWWPRSTTVKEGYIKTMQLIP